MLRSERQVAGWATLGVTMMLLLGACKTLELLPQAKATAPTQLTAPPPPLEPNAPAGAGALPYTQVQREPAARDPKVPASVAEKRLAQDSANFRSVVFGGFVNNMVSKAPQAALACYSRYRNNDRARNDCLAVVLVGNVIEGTSKGYVVAKRQEAGNNELRAMQATTEDMAADNARLQAMIDSADALVRESQARLSKLREDVAAKRVAAGEAEQARQREEANLAQLQQALKDAKATRDEYQKSSREFKGTPAAKRDLDAEIATMSSKVAQLERNVKQLSDSLVPFKV